MNNYDVTLKFSTKTITFLFIVIGMWYTKVSSLFFLGIIVSMIFLHEYTHYLFCKIFNRKNVSIVTKYCFPKYVICDDVKKIDNKYLIEEIIIKLSGTIIPGIVTIIILSYLNYDLNKSIFIVSSVFLLGTIDFLASLKLFKSVKW